MKEKLDEILKPHLKDGDFSKVGATELAILRLGLYEMKFSQTDKAVIINEAIELAKELGSDQAPKFINGVLDALKADLCKLCVALDMKLEQECLQLAGELADRFRN